MNNLPKGLSNYYLICPTRAEKFSFLINFMNSHKEEKIILFFNTCASVNYYHKLLNDTQWMKGWAYFLQDSHQILDMNVSSIHGQMKQKKRNKIYETFVGLDKGVLIATDVVARGIDLPDVNWIIQFDPPQDPNFYIHRVGRTARAGKEGNVIILCPTFSIQNRLCYYCYLMKILISSIWEWKTLKWLNSKEISSST